MLVASKLAQVVDTDLNQSGFPGPAENPVIQRPAKEVGKDRDQINPHGIIE
jgi:hypothetical protein